MVKVELSSKILSFLGKRVYHYLFYVSFKQIWSQIFSSCRILIVDSHVRNATKWRCILVCKQQYFTVFGYHSPFQTCWELHEHCWSYACGVVCPVCTWQWIHMLEVHWLASLDYTVASSGIFSDSSIFVHLSAVILSYSSCSPTTAFKAYCDETGAGWKTTHILLN
jgi:hypothetical protein